MQLIKVWLLCLICSCQTLFSFTLKEKLIDAEPGAYVVTKTNGVVCFIHLHSKTGARFVFEEITLPLYQAKNIDNWKEWGRGGAQGHGCWLLYEIEINEGRVLECYSPSLKSWVSTETVHPLFLPLISLELSRVSEENRLQKGPTQRPGEVGLRPWGPPQIKNGQPVSDPVYTVYEGQWPSDDTPISGKQVVMYFDKTAPTFPFPYWLQAQDAAVRFRMGAIDSGVDFSSSITHLPRRGIGFKRPPQREKRNLYLTLSAPKYYESLSVYAIDLKENGDKKGPFPFKEKREEEELELCVEAGMIDSFLIQGHEYLWMIVSEDPEIKVESPWTYVH